MTPWSVALRQHPGLAAWCDRGNTAMARGAELWAVLGGLTPPEADTPAESAADTMPEEHRALLGENDTATAAAWRLHAEHGVLELSTLRPVVRRDRARRAWAAFGERARAVETMAEGFGWDLSDAWRVWDQVAAAGDASTVADVASLAGRMVAALRGEAARRVRGAPGEIYSVEQGDDLSRLLPSERLLLTDPLLELEFFGRLDERRLLQYSVRGQNKASRGPIVLCLDESSSMHAGRHTWAKAAALAVARVAKDERRQVLVVHYSTSLALTELDPSNPESVLRVLRSRLGGGTAIGRALEYSREQIVALEARGRKGADVILVTDGVDHDPRALIAPAVAALQAMSARLWTVAIDCEIAASSPLRSAAAAYVRLGGPELGEGASVVPLLGAL